MSDRGQGVARVHRPQSGARTRREQRQQRETESRREQGPSGQGRHSDARTARELEGHGDRRDDHQDRRGTVGGARHDGAQTLMPCTIR